MHHARLLLKLSSPDQKLTDELVHPDCHTIEEIAAAVWKRGKEIYGELERFISAPEPILH